ncbi:MAG: hypothetical protein K2Q20_01455 [Phycisphaerales bacterium]|nr:hypothetical protein [Phycisphaerales bacterium]
MKSTAPFVSVPGDAPYRPLFLMDRKLVAGVVDPITGQPLIREVDLELPVGQAKYRMIRTYGGNADGGCNRHPEHTPNGPSGLGDRPALGQMWDWAGVGWMMSENPVLLFDARYIQHEPTLPRRCWLILDAHHSIPFTQDLRNGTYAAPAWFDAVLTVYRNGQPLIMSDAWHYEPSRPDRSTWNAGHEPNRATPSHTSPRPI